MLQLTHLDRGGHTTAVDRELSTGDLMRFDQRGHRGGQPGRVDRHRRDTSLGVTRLDVFVPPACSDGVTLALVANDYRIVFHELHVSIPSLEGSGELSETGVVRHSTSDAGNPRYQSRSDTDLLDAVGGDRAFLSRPER